MHYESSYVNYIGLNIVLKAHRKSQLTPQGTLHVVEVVLVATYFEKSAMASGNSGNLRHGSRATTHGRKRSSQPAAEYKYNGIQNSYENKDNDYLW